MGLDTTHDAWHGSYSSFYLWRLQLAQAAGYPTVVEQEHPEVQGMLRYELPWEDYTEENYDGVWEEIPSDPLILLLAHSDCWGEIKVEHLLPLANRLEELLPLLESGHEYAGMHQFSPRGRTEQFIDGLRLAFAEGENVEFH